MPDPVLARTDGTWPERHVRRFEYDIYVIIMVFRLGENNKILIEDLAWRLSQIQTYSHLSNESLKEMLAQVADISFLFRFDIQENYFVFLGRNHADSKVY